MASVSFTWIHLLPAQAILEHIFQSASLLVYFRTNSARAHVLIAAPVVIAYFSGYAFQNLSNPIKPEDVFKAKQSELRSTLEKIKSRS